MRELFERRELLVFLVLRDVKIRYRQTFIGVAWVLLQPLFAMAVFTIIFGRLAQLSTDGGGSYFLFVYASLVPWLYFSTALIQSSNSLIDNERLLTKIYFPRLYVPLSPTLTGLLDLAVSTTLLIGLQLLFGSGPLTWRLLTLPLWTGLVFLWVAALGTALSAINVRYRDVRYAIPFVVQILLFASPVAYSSGIVPPEWRPLYALNPLVTVIDGFRWAVIGAPALEPLPIVVSVVTTVLAFTGAVMLFHTSERSFADKI